MCIVWIQKLNSIYLYIAIGIAISKGKDMKHVFNSHPMTLLVI